MWPGWRPITIAGPIRPTRVSASPSGPAATGARPATAPSPSAHPGDHPGDLRLPPREGRSTARCSWARTRTPCPRPAQRTALEVLAANGVETIIQRDDGVTPTPVISHAILIYNRGAQASTCATASSSRRRTTRPPTAASSTTRPTADRPTPTSPPGSRTAPTPCCGPATPRSSASRSPTAIKAATTHQVDFVLPYVDDLGSVIDMDAIRAAGLKLGVDPLGGAAVHYWQPIAERTAWTSPSPTRRSTRPSGS